MENLMKRYPYDEVMLIYRCGSSSYGLTNEHSDKDFIAVLKEFKGMDHFSDDNKEYFVFGIKQWIAKMEYKDIVPAYYLIFNDELLELEDNVVYICDEFKEEFKKYASVDFKDYYKRWLQVNFEYFSEYISRGIYTKTLHHILRVKDFIGNYKKSGKFSLKISDEVKDKILKYKTSEDYLEFKAELEEALDYIKEELNGL